ncbi:phytanoyl-CoA dioxygenase family protein [Paraburkholderia sabiae]|uniref:Phytanoyl-CoA dioxygenase family protein n=1 Tax=Paraburkholderia sabiae TaxID=273251 RepID=A0ABU9QJR8_9BURK|nr:phytanoyl-CoA dioxygenase family protein [Paraburkholderia sabiae]WJZ73492.1 phytanoyl-CoA dioxygenase family protein [Paraburkholderia sabiae]
MKDSETAVLTHGVSQRLACEDVIDEAVAELRINGYTVIDSGLPAELIEKLKSGIDRIYQTQIRELGDEQALASISDTDIARCVLTYDADFLSVATAPNLMKLATRLLGTEFVLMQQNGIINRPDRQNYQVKWHRDLSYQHWTSSKTIAFNALLCVDEFTLENGASFVLPATHHIEAFPTDQFVRQHERQIAAPAGSFIVLDAMLYHRGGINVSNDVRRAVNHLIGLPFLAQQVNFETAFESTGMSAPTDPNVRKYLGFRWSPAANARDWRERRMPSR